jgi:hypothetical protein
MFSLAKFKLDAFSVSVIKVLLLLVLRFELFLITVLELDTVVFASAEFFLVFLDILKLSIDCDMKTESVDESDEKFVDDELLIYDEHVERTDEALRGLVKLDVFWTLRNDWHFCWDRAFAFFCNKLKLSVSSWLTNVDSSSVFTIVFSESELVDKCSFEKNLERPQFVCLSGSDFGMLLFPWVTEAHGVAAKKLNKEFRFRLILSMSVDARLFNEPIELIDDESMFVCGRDCFVSSIENGDAIIDPCLGFLDFFISHFIFFLKKIRINFKKNVRT